MAVITASPKNFASLLEIQAKANSNIEKIKDIFEINQAHIETNNETFKKILTNAEEINKKLFELNNFLKPENKKDDLTEAELEQQSRDEKIISLLTKIESNTNPNNISTVSQSGESPEPSSSSFSKLGQGLKNIKGNIAGLAAGMLGTAAALTILSFSLKNFSEIEWTSIAKAGVVLAGLTAAIRFAGEGESYKAFLAVSGGLSLLSFSLKNFKDIGLEEIGKATLVLTALTAAIRLAGEGESYKAFLAVSGGLLALSFGLKNFKDISFTEIGKATLVLTALTAAIRLAGDSKSALAFAVVSGSLIALSFGLRAFEKLGWDSLAKGGAVLLGVTAALVVLGKASQHILIGSAAVAIMAGSLWLLGKALTVFEDMEWETLGKAATALIGFSVAVGVLGALMTTGVGALIFGAGIIAIMSLGAALAVLGGGAILAGKGLDSVAGGLEGLSNLDGENLKDVAIGIGAISAALLAFGTSQMIGAITNLVTKFLSIGQDSPLQQLEKISSYGPGIEKAANGLENMALSLKKLGEVDISNLKDVSKAVKDLNDAKNSSNTSFSMTRIFNRVKEKTVSIIDNITPSTSSNADNIYNESFKVDSLKEKSKEPNSPTIVSAPVMNSSSTKNMFIRPSARNQEPALNYYLKSRFAI